MGSLPLLKGTPVSLHTALLLAEMEIVTLGKGFNPLLSYCIAAVVDRH